MEIFTITSKDGMTNERED